MRSLTNLSYSFQDAWTDAIGQQHTAAALDQCRIVSLVPSLTELVIELGLKPYLVGRTGFCIHPADAVQDIPKIGGTKDVNIEKIRKLAPTHLIVNIDENLKEIVEQLAQFIPHVIVTHPNHPVDNLDLYCLFANIFSAHQRATELCVELLSALRKLAEKPHEKKSVLYCIWKDPWMTVSSETYIAAMLSLRGWSVPIVDAKVIRYPAFEWDKLDLTQIDQIYLSSEPYRFEQIHCDQLAFQTGKNVALIDGEMISWYGSRAIAGVNYLSTR